MEDCGRSEKDMEDPSIFRSFVYENDSLKVIDQRELPDKTEYVTIVDVNTAFTLIKGLAVRGAPCIAAVACLSIVVDIYKYKSEYDKPTTVSDLISMIEVKSDYLLSARPTAVNLGNSLKKLIKYSKSISLETNVSVFIDLLKKFCEDGIEVSLKTNYKISEAGATAIIRLSDIKKKFNVLTHCNTGSLATVGLGTALGAVKILNRWGQLKMLYFTETRPLHQGSRLTGYECVKENVPCTLICDSSVAFLMKTRAIDAVIVGADRITMNGDVYNKIGTLSIAIAANHFGVPFFVAAPRSTIDADSSEDKQIEIEERKSYELCISGTKKLTVDGMQVWNPAFDITPANLITLIITEAGPCKPTEISQLFKGWTDIERDRLDF